MARSGLDPYDLSAVAHPGSFPRRANGAAAHSLDQAERRVSLETIALAASLGCPDGAACRIRFEVDRDRVGYPRVRAPSRHVPRGYLLVRRSNSVIRIYLMY